MNDSFSSKLLRLFGNIVLAPKKVFGNPAYYGLKQAEEHWEAIKKGEFGIESIVNVENKMEQHFKEALDAIRANDYSNQDEMKDLANDLYIAFTQSRRFKEGWVIDGYWELYKKLNRTNHAILDTVTGF